MIPIRRSGALLGVLALASIFFVIWLYNATIVSYEIGSGFAFRVEIEQNGIPINQWPDGVEPNLRIEIEQNSDSIGFQYAALMAILWAFLFGVVLSLIIYGFDLKFMTTARVVMIGFGQCILAAIFFGLAQTFLGRSIEQAARVAIGLGIILIVSFGFLFIASYFVRRALGSSRDA